MVLDHNKTRLAMAPLVLALASIHACSFDSDRQNSLSQNTGNPGSTMPKGQAPYYPNTSGNIVAPPGNPGGNAAGAPPIVGGTSNQHAAWPDGR